MSNSYLSVHDYLRAIQGQETASLIGNLIRVNTGGVVLGATSLPVTPNTTVNLNQYDIITIFDGSSTEEVTVTATTASGASSIPITATAFAHAAGVSCCSDGTYGSLAQAILDASAEVERICEQPLLQQTNTGEELPLRTTRAMIDNYSKLIVRARQFPITSVSALAIVFNAGNTVTLDTTQVLIDTLARFFTVPTIKTTGAGNNYVLGQYANPHQDGLVQITYQAGYVYSALPSVVRRAAVWLVSDILTDRINPTGAAESQQGKIKRVTYLRGDLSGETAIVKRARNALLPYSQSAI